MVDGVFQMGAGTLTYANTWREDFDDLCDGVALADLLVEGRFVELAACMRFWEGVTSSSGDLRFLGVVAG